MSENALLLSSGEAARLVGVHESSIKRWCNTGDLSCLSTGGGHRRIALEALLAFARGRGLSSPLLAFAPLEARTYRALLRARAREEYQELVDLVFAWLEEGIADLPVRLFLLCRGMGMKVGALFDGVMAPVMHRIGGHWFDGLLAVGTEHRITQVMVDVLHRLRPADRFIAARQDGGGGGSACVALVACSQGTHHELGALMTRVVLEEAGWRVVYLGPDVPDEDLALQQSASGAQLVCVSIVPPGAPADARRVVNALARTYAADRPYRLVLGGGALAGGHLAGLEAQPFAGLEQFASLAAFSDWLDTSYPNT